MNRSRPGPHYASLTAKLNAFANSSPEPSTQTNTATRPPSPCDCDPYLAAVKAIWRLLIPARVVVSRLVIVGICSRSWHQERDRRAR
jgi:hypothetical protein